MRSSLTSATGANVRLATPVRALATPAAGSARSPLPHRSTPPNWRRPPCAAVSSPPISSPSRSAFSSPIWSMAGCAWRFMLGASAVPGCCCLGWRWRGRGTKWRRHRHPVRSGRLHYLLCLFGGTGDVDGDQRGLPRAYPWPGRRCRHGGQLGLGLSGQPVLPGIDRGDRGFIDLWLFALFCVLAWVWIYFRVPETKGQSLEQIQQLWKQPA